MYRISSKGNPYHDALGRFTSADGKGKNLKTGVIENRPVEKWSSFGEVHDKDEIKGKKDKEKAWKELDRDRSQVAYTDGRRHYHNQSITREKNAQAKSTFAVPKGLTAEERTNFLMKKRNEFDKENAVAIKKGASVSVHKSGNQTILRIVEPNRIADEVGNPRSADTRNTATSMKKFHGYTVEFTSGNTVRSCKTGASRAEVAAGIKKFNFKHKKDMATNNVALHCWNDSNNRVRFMPVFAFDTEAEAKAFAANHKNARVVNHDDGYMG